MGGFCSDPGRRPDLQNLRYTIDEGFDLNESSDGETPSERTGSEHSTPSITKVPISAIHRRVYRNERKERQNFFDLDSVDEVNEVAEKALSDITSIRYKPKKRARLTRANLSIRDHQSTPSLRVHRHNLRFNSQRPSSVCSDQPGWNDYQPRSRSSSRAGDKMPKSLGDARRDSDKSRLGYSTDERSFNTLDPYEKSESDSDSLKFPRKKEEAKGFQSEEELKKCNVVDIVNKPKPCSQYTSETDITSLRNNGSSACSSYDLQQRDRFRSSEECKHAAKRCSRPFSMKHDFQQPPEVPMLIQTNNDDIEIELPSRRSQRIVLPDELNKENDIDVGLIFSTSGNEALLNKDWSQIDYTQKCNENVVLP